MFAELPVDDFYLEEFPHQESDHIFSVEYLPGQFDQRADSAVQCVQFLDENAQPIIRSATTYVIEGTITDEEFDEECSVISPLLLVILRCSIKHTDVHCMVACCWRDFLVDAGG